MTETEKTCGTCAYFAPAKMDKSKGLCYGMPPTPVGDYMDSQTVRPTVLTSEKACSLYSPEAAA